MSKKDYAIIPVSIPKELWEKIQADAPYKYRLASGQIRWVLEQYYSNNAH
ncbi:hypothetical protein NIES22_50810 [Calothrix brevissima NIES-22]|nr:hypothetical protein NIES22_50810 [Calothrix brevissima NIES-22]